MNDRFLKLLLLSWWIGIGAVHGQLITMDNKCYRLVKEGNAANKAREFEKGLAIFQQVMKDCKARDAKNQGNAGLAMSLNGVGRFQEAINAANASLRFSKNRNVTAWYARGLARRKLGDEAGAKADFARVTELTTKNRNVKERATIFAEIADLDWQSGMKADAMNNLEAAIALDPTNADFFVQKGDMLFYQGDYDGAFTQYDKAVELGRSGLEMYQLRTEMRLKQYQDKYRTTEANELAGKMTSDEKTKLCREINQAKALGLKIMSLDLLAARICN